MKLKELFIHQSSRMKTALTTLLGITCIAFNLHSQPVIKYDPQMARLPDFVESLLKDIMTKSLVSEIVVTSEMRTPEKQIDLMFACSKQGNCASYAPEGQAVIKVYKDNKDKNEAEVKALMLAELKKQLPTAMKHCKLMHVRTQDDFIVFDISQTRISPLVQIQKLETEAKSRVPNEIWRFLGTDNRESGAFHFEIKNPAFQGQVSQYKSICETCVH